MGIRVSVDVEELVKAVPESWFPSYVYVSREDFTKLCIHFKEPYDSTTLKMKSVVFTVKPSVTDELDRLLCQRVSPSSDDRFVMSLDVWQQYCEEKGLTPKSLENIKMYERPNYRGVFIETRDKVDGGVQLKCDYYVKGNL